MSDDGADVCDLGLGDCASLSAPAKEMEKLVLGAQLRHDGHPVLRWCVSNMMVEIDGAGSIKPSKRRSTERIDGVVALVMALGLSIVREKKPEWNPTICWIDLQGEWHESG